MGKGRAIEFYLPVKNVTLISVKNPVSASRSINDEIKSKKQQVQNIWEPSKLYLPTSCYTINNPILTYIYASNCNHRRYRSLYLRSPLTHRQKYRLQTRRSLRQ